MDENGTNRYELEMTPRLHNRWSVLVLAASWGQQVAAVTADTMTGVVKMAVEHASQKNYDREFNNITKES